MHTSGMSVREIPESKRRWPFQWRKEWGGSPLARAHLCAMIACSWPIHFIAGLWSGGSQSRAETSEASSQTTICSWNCFSSMFVLGMKSLTHFGGLLCVDTIFNDI